jgi:group I intron endonuclease
MENKSFIYTLSDPITKKVRYVGKTDNLDYRLKKHINESKNKRTHKEKWVDSLITQGLTPIMDILDIVNKTEWCFYETYWISQMKTWGFDLTNGTYGGEGSDGFKGKKHSNETKEKCRIAGSKSKNRLIGEKNGRCKLTDIQVEEIKNKVSLGIEKKN